MSATMLFAVAATALGSSRMASRSPKRIWVALGNDCASPGRHRARSTFPSTVLARRTFGFGSTGCAAVASERPSATNPWVASRLPIPGSPKPQKTDPNSQLKVHFYRMQPVQHDVPGNSTRKYPGSNFAMNLCSTLEAAR